MFSSLKSRLVLLLVLVALPGVAVIYQSAQYEHSQAIERIRSEALKASDTLATRQREIIDKTHSFLEQLARQPAVQNPHSAKCSEFLATLLALDTTFINLGVPDHQGQLHCNALVLEKPADLSDRVYIQTALHHQTFSISTFQNDPVTNSTAVNFAYPVYSENGGLVSGAVVATVSSNWWSNQLKNLDFPPQAVAMIADTSNTIVAAYPYMDYLLGSSSTQFSFDPFLSGDNSAWTEISDDQEGIQRLFVHSILYQTSSGGSLTLSVGFPIEEAIQAANQHFVDTMLYFSVGMCILAMLAHYGLVVTLIRPIRKLTAATEKLERGEIDVAATPSGTTELSTLESRFIHMAQIRLRAEETAKQRHAELKAVFSSLPDLYFRVSKTGHILDFRTAEENDLYLQPGAFLNKRITDLMPEQVSAGFDEKMKQHFKTGRVTHWLYELPMNGENRIYEARLNTIKGTSDLTIVVRDVTEQKKNEESLQLAAMVYQNSSECMVVTDSNGIVLNINHAFTVITGYQENEIAGHNISTLKSGKQDTFFYKKLWSQLSRTGRWQGEIYNRRKNGEIFPAWLTIDTVYLKDKSDIRRVGLYRDITEKKKADEVIWHQAHFDTLTQLPNRSLFNDRLRQEIIKCDRKKTALAVLFIDLDHFKEVNDSLGHDMGDQLLKDAAGRMVECLRAGDTVARQGGDEFILLLTDIGEIQAIEDIIKRIMASVSQPFDLSGNRAFVTASIGIALYPDDADNTHDLMKSADQAMYTAKQAGKNRHHYFTRAIQDQALSRVMLIDDLHRALDECQFQLYYQPIVETGTNTIVKLEALIRWQHPKRGIVQPTDFITTAEETRLINTIGSWVFETVTHDMGLLKRHFGNQLQVSVNVSPVQFSSRNSGLEHWPRQLEQQGLAGHSIVIEITEGLMMGASKLVSDRLKTLNEAGIQLALDDFGTGFSSLSYIRKYLVDYIKIDQSFIRNLQNDTEAGILCKAISGMADNLRISVIAEGVETPLQQEFLRKMGCRFAQGYFYSQPLPIDQLLELPPVLVVAPKLLRNTGL